MNARNKLATELGQKVRQADFGLPNAYPHTRGYQKLANAVQSLGIDFRGLVVLDIGSSTGGFTSYALEHGAKQVIAVEKGTNQMIAPLRFHPKVELHEKTDIFVVRLQSNQSNRFRPKQSKHLQSNQPNRLQSNQSERTITNPSKSSQTIIFIPTPDLILADVSFISLSSVLSYAKHYLADRHTRFLVMLKPQFEAKPSELRNGVIKNSKIRRQIIKNFEEQLKKHGFHIIKKLDNQLAGRSGNLERFYYLSLET